MDFPPAPPASIADAGLLFFILLPATLFESTIRISLRVAEVIMESRTNFGRAHKFYRAWDSFLLLLFVNRRI